LNILSLFPAVRNFILEADGVLTDGRISLGAGGKSARNFHTRDIYALELAAENGYRVHILGGNMEILLPSALQHFFTDAPWSIPDRKLWLDQWMHDSGYKPGETLYMGSDIPSLAAMQSCGLPCCPADAVHEIKKAAAYISPANGGYGCVRDVVEKVLKLNGHWPGV